jgi:hypothetical protein
MGLSANYHDFGRSLNILRFCLFPATSLKSGDTIVGEIIVFGCLKSIFGCINEFSALKTPRAHKLCIFNNKNLQFKQFLAGFRAKVIGKHDQKWEKT